MWGLFGSCSHNLNSPIPGLVLIIASTCLSIPSPNTQVLLIVFTIECAVVDQI